jgi:hypothetical protein
MAAISWSEWRVSGGEEEGGPCGDGALGRTRVEKTRVRGGTRPSVGERGGGEEAGPVGSNSA